MRPCITHHYACDCREHRMKLLEAVADAAKMLQAYKQNSTDPYDIPIWETELERLLDELEKG